jgi:hypothetical protein
MMLLRLHVRHTTKLPGITTEVTKQLETYFTFVPPLVVAFSDNLESSKSISLDDIDAEFALLEDIRKAEKIMNIEFASNWDADGKEVLERRAFDLKELQRIDKGLVPAATEDEIMVTDRNANKDET